MAPLEWRSDRVVVIARDGTIYVDPGGEHAVVLRSRLFRAIGPLVDGQRDERALVAAASNTIEPVSALATVRRLVELGHLRRRGDQDVPVAGTIAISSTCAFQAASDRDAVSKQLDELLTDAGARVVDEEQHPDLVLTLARHWSEPELAEIGRRRCIIRQPWLLVVMGNHPLTVGPLFRPGTAGCPTCLATRVSARRPAEHLALAEADLAAPPPMSTATLAARSTLLSFAAQRAARPTAPDLVLNLVDPLDLSAAVNHLVPVPGCPDCDLGCTSLVTADNLGSAVASHDGGWRQADPDDTWDRLEHLVGRLTGVVPYVAASRQVDRDLHVFASGPNLAFGPTSLDSLLTTRSSSGGKGLSRAQARTGALCEALERASCLRRGDEPVVLGSRGQLPNALDPNDIQLYSAAQLADPAKRTGAFTMVNPRLGNDEVVEWTELTPVSWSGSARPPVLVPTDLCYYGLAGRSRFFADSNGTAAGNSFDEALLQGLLELTERDAVAMWWYSMARRPAVDPRAFADSTVLSSMSPAQRLGYHVELLDITNDLGIPTYVATAHKMRKDGESLLFGFGSHLSPQVAACRAITEANQCIAGVECGKEALGNEMADWLSSASLTDKPYFLPQGTSEPPSEPALPSVSAALQRTVAQIEAVGVSVYALDCTRRDYALPVVRAVAPGLRHFWTRFAPGRLYSVPVQLGWVDNELQEDELNPVPMFL